MIFLKIDRPINDLIIISSILIGVLAFSISFVIIKSNFKLKSETLNVFISNSTKLSLNQNEGTDTLIIKARDLYADYLSKVMKTKIIYTCHEIRGMDCGTYVIKIPTTKSKSKREIVKTEKVTFNNKSKIFEKYSTILYQQPFFSNDSSKLVKYINEFDIKYRKKINEKYKDILVDSRYHLNTHPTSIYWILLVSITIGFSFCIIPFLIAGICKLSMDLNKNITIGNIVISLTVLLCLVLPQLLTSHIGTKLLIRPLDVEHYFEEGFSAFAINYSAVMLYIGPFIWFIMILTLNSKLSYLFKNDQEKLIIKDFKEIRKLFDNSFVVIAILLFIATYSTSTLLEVLNDLLSTSSNSQLFPKEFGFYNGLIQTSFLVLIYFIVNSNLIYTQTKLQEANPEKFSFSDATTGREKFFKILKTFITLMAPIIGSELTTIFSLLTQ